MTASMRRENVPVTEVEQSILELLRQLGSPERRALEELVGELGTSRAQVAHAVLAVGLETLRERMQDIGYTQLAASYSEAETEQRRAEVGSRRARASARWAADE